MPHNNLVQTEQRMAAAVRMLAADSVQRANSGHPGMPLGMADAVTVLFNRFIRLDPSAPQWPDRDRFILSAGHGSMLHYALNHLLGYADMTTEELKNFRQHGARTAGHPEHGHAQGIEMTTGPLGQGIASAVGMALAERIKNAHLGDDLINHYTYVIAGDGCLQEGISHEAIDLAGHLGLDHLIVFWDDNHISIDGATSLSTSMDQGARFCAAGWDVQFVDGHDNDAIAAAVAKAQKTRTPSLIACKTTIGCGAPTLQGSAKTHGAPLGADEIVAMRAALDWTALPFEVPADINSAWRAIAEKGHTARRQWEKTLASSHKSELLALMEQRTVPDSVGDALRAFRNHHQEAQGTIATRKASQMVLEVINTHMTNTIGGSADLTGSNLTKTAQLTPISRDNYAGRYIHYGIREHGMAAVMNGLSLHGGFIPYGGTFLVFADYMRGGMRLSALMGQGVIYVLTHDSIGLGEDGPTHQPIEQLAMLRATPNLNVLRPADIVETAECWEVALHDRTTPSVLALSRQGLKTLPRTAIGANQSALGAYVLQEAEGTRDITLIATGSEVEIALNAAEILRGDAIAAAVVSMPCWEKFAMQESAYRQSVLGSAPRLAVEAASDMGWHRWVGDDGDIIAMQGFGASAPAEKLYERFGFTASNIAARARALLGRGRHATE